MNALLKGKGSPALYLQIKNIYKNKIISGQLKRGDRIDSELESQKEYGVSRITARQAIVDLEKEGMVKRGRGKGTFVIYREAIEEELNRVRSFTKEMESQGRVPGTQWTTLQIEKMSEGFSKDFGIYCQQEMYCLRRVRTADDIRVAYFVSYFPLSLNLPMDVNQIPESIYEQLDYIGIKTPGKIREKVKAILPNKEVAKALNIQDNQPILLRQRQSFDKQGNTIEYTNCYYRGDMYWYIMNSEKEE